MIDSRNLRTDSFPVGVVFLKRRKSRGGEGLIKIFQLVVVTKQWCVDTLLLNFNRILSIIVIGMG
jgi:hypothetical protein